MQNDVERYQTNLLLSSNLFNLILDKIIRVGDLNRADPIFCKSPQLLAYAHNIDIYGRISKALCAQHF